MQIIEGPNVNLMEGHAWPLNEHQKFHFDNEKDIHTSFEHYEANGYMCSLDLLIISH